MYNYLLLYYFAVTLLSGKLQHECYIIVTLFLLEYYVYTQKHIYMLVFIKSIY